MIFSGPSASLITGMRIPPKSNIENRKTHGPHTKIGEVAKMGKVVIAKMQQPLCSAIWTFWNGDSRFRHTGFLFCPGNSYKRAFWKLIFNVQNARPLFLKKVFTFCDRPQNRDYVRCLTIEVGTGIIQLRWIDRSLRVRPLSHYFTVMGFFIGGNSYEYSFYAG